MHKGFITQGIQYTKSLTRFCMGRGTELQVHAPGAELILLGESAILGGITLPSVRLGLLPKLKSPSEYEI